MRRGLAFAVAGLLTSPGVPAEDQRTFTQWDANSDGELTEAEFLQRARSADWFSAWDRDGDGQIGPDEFARVDFDARLSDWDADDDGRLNRRELWRGAYRTYDVDQDGTWGLGEWADAIERPWFNP